MRVGLITGKRELSLREFPTPSPEPGKAVVQIASCGICGTDVHAYMHGGPYTPAICGHEWAGTVSACGTGVKKIREGDRVAIGGDSAPMRQPGQCGNCRFNDEMTWPIIKICNQAKAATIALEGGII